MADKRISQLIERTNIANNDVLPIVASGATTTNKVTISTIQDWMQDNLDVGVTSVGLSMPSAFVVSNSPVTASGNITVTGAGTVSQYIRGDGSLADFPQSSGGGGASVSYYLNGSVSQGTIGGIAYREMNKTPIFGTGTDITINANGYIASFITDAGDPALLEIPGGNWNFETYLSASSGGGSPTFYIELYKVNSGGTATLIASNSATPELIAFGTTINPYFSALAVPTTVLTLTDRLALRYYVTHAGRTITLHTENSHLCQIITTFTTGLTALNGLTAQVQNFATGTTGTDFNISSAGSTHTFNIPSASATARGLVTTGSQTIAGAKTFSDDAIINGVNVGRGASSVATNTRLGFQSLTFNTTGSSNTSVGWNSLYLNTTGSSNSSFGTLALENNTTGTGNTASGYAALRNNTTGGSNTATGYLALSANTTGNANTATGAYALENNTTGTDNTAVGQNALENNTTANGNTGIGFNALQSNTIGSSNTAAGRNALRSNTEGNSNTAFGWDALTTNTVSGANTAVGNQALRVNTGGENTAVGFLALFENTTGQNNTALGESALLRNTTGSNNIGIGNDSGSTTPSGQNTTGSNSIFIGGNTKGAANNQTNQIVIGHNAIGNGSNTVTLGNDSITNTYLKGAVTLTGALNGTSAVFSEQVRINQAGQSLLIFPTTTSSARMQIQSSGGGNLVVGTESSAGGDLASGTSAYASVFTSGSTRDLFLGTNSVQRLKIDGSTGEAIFSSSVTATANVTISSTTNSSLVAATNSTSGFTFIDLINNGASGRNYQIGLGGNGAAAGYANNLYFDLVGSGNIMTLTSGRNVGIGTASPDVYGFGGSGRYLTLQSNSGGFSLMQVISDGTSGSGISFGNTTIRRASIDAVNGSDLTFNTNASNNGSTLAERMRITSGGQVQITQSANSHAAGGLTLINNAGNPWNFVNGGDNNLYLGYAGTSRGVFATNGVYTAISDKNKKKDFEDSTIGLNEILQLKPTLYRMIEDESEGKKELGFIAQEVNEFIPQAYVESGEEDAKFIGLNYNAIVAALVKSVQEQQEQIKSLSEQVEALKSQING